MASNSNTKDNEDKDDTPPVTEQELAAESLFAVIGTFKRDTSFQPAVLSPTIMDALRPHLPYACQQDNFWLKYSMLRHVSLTRDTCRR